MILRTGIRCFFLAVLFFSCVSKLYCFRISTPSVLLPYNFGLPSAYIVEVSGTERDDCFNWKSANSQIVSVTPIFASSNCSKKAILSSVANLSERKVTRISANLKGRTDRGLSVDVITDTVASIELSYLSDDLIFGGAPEVLTVIGKDNRGHPFSSINGLEIQWKVSHESEYFESAVEVIRISKFETSQYESPEEDCPWEKRGLFSRSILVEPIELGTATISASLLFTSKPVLHTEAVIKVIPNLKVHPSQSINLLLHASVPVRVETVLDGKVEEVTMENVKVDIENSDVIELSDDYSLLTARKYGSSTVSYKNINLTKRLDNYSGLSMEVQVVNPSRVGLRISDGDFRVLEEMKAYEVFVDLYDENNNLIYPSDNLRISVSFPTKYFHVLYTSVNGTYSVVQALTPGRASIKVDYKGVLLKDGSFFKDHTIYDAFKVTVYQKLNIYPSRILLPLLSYGMTHYEVLLTINAGTRNYSWALSDYKVAKVSEDKENKNKLRLEVFGEVNLIVTVSDRNNPNFITTAEVSVQLPIDIETYPTVVEAEVGNILIIPTALLGYEDKEKDIVRKFDNCSKIEPTIDIVDKNILSLEKEYIPEFGRGCMNLQFRCKHSGHSRINIEYSLNTSDSVVTYKTTTVLACFKPLKPVHPVRVAVLALGTSKEVAFEGGPRKWPLFKDGHYTELEATSADLVEIELIKDPVRYNKDLTVFRVTCRALGENTLTFRIGNQPSPTIQHPAKAETSIKFICAEPHSVHLKLFRKKTSKTLKNENLVKVPFYGEKIFAVDIWVKDAMGRKFANISSLRVVWDLSDKTLARPESYFDFMTHENGVAGYRKLSRNFKEFKMTGDSGVLKVEAKVTSYQKEVLSKQGINDYKELREISKSIELQLVSLRDLNADLYKDIPKTEKEEEEYCENDSCKS